MRTLIFAILFVSLIISCKHHPDSTAHDEVGDDSLSMVVCADVLGFLNLKPGYLQLQDCDYEKGQVLYGSRYCLSGKYAEYAERFFVINCKMGALKFVCCGWENADGKAGQCAIPMFLRNINPSVICSVTMFSEETLIDNRTLWNDSLMFYVFVEIIQC